MAGTEIALPLQDYIASLDKSALPKILQVCSGVYFQGSVYELSGSEVCFSTGDLIKVVDVDLISVCCEDISNNKFELPINHTALLKVVPEQMSYSSLEELVSLRPVGLESSLPVTFISHSKITFDNFTLGAGKPLTILSIDRHEGEEDQVCCQVQGQQGVLAKVCIPISTRGEFCECESKDYFTLRQIMSSSCLRSCRFRFTTTTMYKQPFVVSPIYQVHAVMSMRKNVLKFPSSLEIDVLDVTDLCKDVKFVKPLSLTEVFSQPDNSFPAVVEITEGPEIQTLFKCNWLPELTKGKLLVLHRKSFSPMVLVSSLKTRKVQQYFLVSQKYGGRFRRRPREFNSVYELYVATLRSSCLRVRVTKHSEEVMEEGLPALTVGDQLEILRCETVELPCGSSKEPKQSTEVLVCQCIQEADKGSNDDDDDDDDDDEIHQGDDKEEIFLPLYMQCNFMEILPDNKKYKLSDLGKAFTLPLDVKLVNRDTELETDPLAGFPCLRIEGAVFEPTIEASLPHSPGHCFEIPTQKLSMSVAFTKESLPWSKDQPPKFHMATVTQVTDVFYHDFWKAGKTDVAPPPRPPKRNKSTSGCLDARPRPSSKPSVTEANSNQSKDQKSISTETFGCMTLNKRRPPVPSAAVSDSYPPPIFPRKDSVKPSSAQAPPNTYTKTGVSSAQALPNTYTKIRASKREVKQHQSPAEEDSDHDYESVDEPLAEVMKRLQEDVTFY
ncbi:protein THEMIS2 [Thalassophryne amazonica]|uniref:protein THEMIS2 n=1 Tax=Thalassophryne amazonica TaxID=390379 RepID=UPI001471261F|nr:protein THEMIS2 [Thalassophryne amazonica]